ncbi:DEAD/DEAH box helicase [Acinetobacter qingfengensis]|uniref:Type III deoxyribonuclease n=1 Tax=Acinetobacter qingfengensis TaxID=1262585 RepID=A0A1E7R9C1_9GAMM|nr:DEAD/DEAH box helicase family protein [Acinetobacter qingfengensis]KAA8735439.1 DEAD/DEAH box helicase [Acinetobacter qingfengensis]OEY95916.1 type III deoxyribonuclease [Acinetobacter qingfengensis]
MNLVEFFHHPLAQQALMQINVPESILYSLKHPVRSYQFQALKQSIYFFQHDFEYKPSRPYHLMYNMATGSGKTMLMAALMLYLYQQGYRYFLFFVNSSTIMQKTQVNFLDPQNSKYLFKSPMLFNDHELLIKSVENFDEADSEHINIKFTTLQQLHSDLNKSRENALTLEDFKDKKIVLIADEAHHLNSGTKSGEMKGSWESTVLQLLQQHSDNILLEFTATLDADIHQIYQKYQHKVIYQYDLKQFCQAGYSKHIDTLASDFAERERILQALLLNLYREDIAAKHHINLKPVILFKAKRSIKESEQNKRNFHHIIEDLHVSHIEYIEKNATADIIQQIFSYFKGRNISFYEIVSRLKSNFKFEHCLSANNEIEAERNQILLNTLEDLDNPIRAIFAVQKLNEGWDVLNLFDIVRLYEDRDGIKHGKIGKTTLSEAQLIGRGARYYPFELKNSEFSRDQRKFDQQPDHELRILEELYYHTVEDNRYISELRQALISIGLVEDQYKLIQRNLSLKESFKQSVLYQQGLIFLNDKQVLDTQQSCSFIQLGIRKRNFHVSLKSGRGYRLGLLTEDRPDDVTDKVVTDLELTQIPEHTLRYALSEREFFHFQNLKQYFPALTSISEFIQSQHYLMGVSVSVHAQQSIHQLDMQQYIGIVRQFLQQLEHEIKQQVSGFAGTHFTQYPVASIFKDKVIFVEQNSERSEGQEQWLATQDWYAFTANYGTSEEKAFVQMMARQISTLQQNFADIYLIRNERAFKIYDIQGRAFEPDFVLYCQKYVDDQCLIYQVFIEPKGEHLKDKDQWKADFLQCIAEQKQHIQLDHTQYRITALPFYHARNENEFIQELRHVLDIQ